MINLNLGHLWPVSFLTFVSEAGAVNPQLVLEMVITYLDSTSV